MSANMQEIVVRLPENLLNEVDGLIREEDSDLNDIIYEATKSYVRDKKEQHIRESMQRGYIEMAKINLNIASESFLAEEEAETTLERLVSGV
ncbi:CopG family transcriptional regulator / antitoxin EndoAI [Amphibacillus marinus]|uniref:CopG family transcriptional regulator / antitoxin EndoAI n=2 Tax=Amphibacillus marinus TaxID=872970 RepID=A0A1H8JPP7_9BACI|nr:CopG family transcriptional regulator / antitoxin EndoAI [Amphibacillus marinus]